MSKSRDVANVLSTHLALSGGTMTGAINMGNQNITNANGVTANGNVTATGNITASGNGTASSGMPVITDATTARTIALSDAGSYIRFTSGSAVTVTIDPVSSTNYPVGTEVVLFAAGAGTVTVSPGLGVTINSKDAALSIDGQYASATLKHIASDEWDLIGALA